MKEETTIKNFEAIRMYEVSTGAMVPTLCVKFKCESIDDARHWVINHLDCSYEWDVVEVDIES